MKEILSKQNEIIKELKKQKLKNRFLLFLDNPKTIREAIQNNYTCEMLLIDKLKQDNFSDIVAKEKILTTESIIKEFTDLKSPQGVVGVFQFSKRKLEMPKGNFLVLDEIQDSGNIGTLLRSALGFNFIDVYLVNSASLTNEKVVRSSMASILKLNCYETTREEFVKFTNENNLQFVCADMDGENILSTKLNTPIGIVLGNEGNGVSRELKECSKGSISIPMSNNLESLNVGVAGSILMFQIENIKKGK